MYNGAPVNDMVHIEVSAYKGSLYSKGDYELKTLSYSMLKEGNISVLNPSLNGVARIMMIPTSGVALAVTAITSDGRAYIGRMDRSLWGIHNSHRCRSRRGYGKRGRLFL